MVPFMYFIVRVIRKGLLISYRLNRKREWLRRQNKGPGTELVQALA